MINYIAWLIAGVVLGGITTLITHRRRSILLFNIIFGGAIAVAVGTFLLPLFHIDTTTFSIVGLLVVLGSIIVLLAVVNFFVREHTVAYTLMQEKWAVVSYKIRARWSKITKEEVEQINGDHDKFVDVIGKRYGVADKEAEDQLQRFLKAVITKIS